MRFEHDDAEQDRDPAPRAEGEDVAVAGAAGDLLQLQRAAGNQAVAQMLAADIQRPAAAPGPAPRRGSPARLLRSHLRAEAAGRRLMRAVTTSGGEWDTTKYDLLQDVDQSGNAAPAAWGLRGLDIDLTFNPNNHVDAETIGLTQSVQAFVNNAPNLTPAAATRAIPAADAININTGPGETDQGTAIDRAAGFNNPIYPVSNPASASLDDPATSPGWGQHGFHYTDKNVLKHQNANLKDKPMRSGAQKDSRHIFETTALATKGAQAGTYYGSVRWGWRTDAKGTFTKLPLEKVSDGVPSSSFLKAAGIWNPGTSSTGAQNVDLPIPDVKVTTAMLTPLVRPVPFAAIQLPMGTRLQVVREWSPPLLAGTVKVVDGPHTGVTGEVDSAYWSSIADERS